MAEGTKSTILIAAISAVSAIVVAAITTYGTIAVSAPEARKVKAELQDISNLEKIANMPIGTILPSMLRPTEFAKEVGDLDRKQVQWTLADGAKDITHSRYGQLSGNTKPPDLRGMFLRGVEDGRQPGDYQADALQVHGHVTDALKVGQYVDRDTKELGYTTRGGADIGTASVTAVTHIPGEKDVNIADETRPKNVAVYFYIKIN